ncbi:hypothetical protein KC318_g77 [Hortaea werneckii]|nr:hypothetical protein KC334_g87 [Hortaea werneckii]KAI7028138.1 hypothetical protein KC355_g76 [Hortaea werneckii]KAI7676736.1 hypothetical protein KC318_g77 [Hortaea werneckii]
MTVQLPHSPDSFPPPSFDDPAFEPQALFDFEDPNDESIRNTQNSFSPSGYIIMDTASGSGAFGVAYEPSPGRSNAFSQGMSSTSDPADVWGQPIGSSPAFSIQINVGLPSGGLQNHILSKRGAYGQITHPNDTTPTEAFDRQSSAPPHSGRTEIDQLQRSRNAATQRHAKSKSAREASLHKHCAEPNANGNADDVEDKQKRYREKNRAAAARCRAKKQEDVKGLEERHRELYAKNSYMKREERVLRGQLRQLRTMALLHNEELCTCHDIHGYNFRKANEVALSWNQPVSSPSGVGSTSNAPSPDTFSGIMGNDVTIDAKLDALHPTN